MRVGQQRRHQPEQVRARGVMEQQQRHRGRLELGRLACGTPAARGPSLLCPCRAVVIEGRHHGGGLERVVVGEAEEDRRHHREAIDVVLLVPEDREQAAPARALGLPVEVRTDDGVARLLVAVHPGQQRRDDGVVMALEDARAEQRKQAEAPSSCGRDGCRRAAG